VVTAVTLAQAEVILDTALSQTRSGPQRRIAVAVRDPRVHDGAIAIAGIEAVGLTADGG
jgi:hypothetical protein